MDGITVMCRRESHGTQYLDERLEPYWIYKLNQPCDMTQIQRPPPQYKLVSHDQLNEVYCSLLAQLSLSNTHSDQLQRRGLNHREIASRHYRTLPREGRSRIAKALHERFGDGLCGVPGFYYHEEGYWSLWAIPGLVIPLRDMIGRIVALKIRADDPKYPKYSYVSAAKKGGPSAVKAIHVPLWDGSTDTVVVTEGELKADVCTVLGNTLTISLPGIGSWRLALDVIQQLRPSTVRIALDQDPPENKTACKQVKAARDGLYRQLNRVKGLDVCIDEWDLYEDGKGLDDVLLKLQQEKAA